VEVSDTNPLREAIQTVDPAVSSLKFEEELSIFLRRQDAQRRRGIILLSSDFPNLEFMFLATHLHPSPAAFGIRINFENYDLQPLSIQVINPFTGELLKANQVAVPFLRKNPSSPMAPPLSLLQFESPDGIPFFCMPGVREYHLHPYHTGDSWLLHRKNGGEGTLGYLLDKLHEYGINSLNGFNVSLSFSQLPLGVDLTKLVE
jgi:hypothetical protein